jgi:outer membrane cobalamin receptor
MESKSFPAKTSSTKRHGYNSNDISLDIGKTILDYTLTTKIFSSTGNTQYDNFGSNADQDHDDYFYTINLKKSIGQDELNIGYTKSQNKILQNVTNYLGFIDFTKTLRDKYEISYTKIDNRFLNKFGLNYTKEHMSEKSFSQRYIINPIVRELFYQGDYISSSNIVNYGLRQIHHSQFGSFTAGNFGLSLINNDDVYSFNINRAFRSPDGTDNYGYKGNPNLLPEESLSYEVSMKRFLNKNFMVRGSIFVTDIKNLIAVDGAQVQNIDESEITGYEINAQYDDNLFEYNFSYTYMNPKDKTNNEVLAKRSKHKLNTGVTYKVSNKSSMNLNIVGEGEKNASYFSTTMLGSYYIANLNYNVDISNSSLNLSLKNLFDKEYRNSDGYNTADRSFFVTYSLNY